MEATLQKLLDFQCFAQNNRLAAIITDVESRYQNALSDDDLAFVNAAGEAALPARPLEGSQNDR